MYKILQTPKFKKWYFKQDLKIKTIISSRLKRVKDSGELGDIKYLGNKLFEFRWRVGIRVYFTERK
jgi:putative component of toxin-antitoxin plasmid stabilization module